MTTRTALLPFGVYLAATLPIALGYATNSGVLGLLLALTHLALAWVLLGFKLPWGFSDGAGPEPVTMVEGGPKNRAEREEWLAWLPILLIPLLYWELPFLSQLLGQGYGDGWVRLLEGKVFPGDPSANMAGEYPWPFLSEGLHLAYLSYYPLIVLPPLFLWIKGSRSLFRESVFRLSLTFTICFVIYVLFPVEGPRYGGVPPVGIPAGDVRGWVLAILESGSARGSAFPSSHVAVAVTQSLFLLTRWKWVGIGALCLSIGLGVGAVYGGFHYGVDALAGAALAFVLFFIVEKGSRLRSGGHSGTTLPSRTF